MACTSGDEKSVDTSLSSEDVESGGDSDTDEETNTDTNDETDPLGPETDIVDSDCIDGEYTEVVPTPDTNISNIESAYTPSNAYGFINDVLGQRYPIGQFIFQNGYSSQGNFPDNCLNYFLGDTSSSTAVIRQLSTIVHECGHFSIWQLGLEKDGYRRSRSSLYL